MVWWFFLAMITVLYVSAFVAIIQTVVFGLGADVFTVKRFVQVSSTTERLKFVYPVISEAEHEPFGD